MYKEGTILVLKEQVEDDPETGPYPFNRVKVIGQSPIEYRGHVADWGGRSGAGVIIQPYPDFGPTDDRPFEELTQYYNIEFEPEDDLEMTAFGRTVKVKLDKPPGASPEDVFAAEAESSGEASD